MPSTGPMADQRPNSKDTITTVDVDLKPHPSFFGRLRAYFFTGLVITAPIELTVRDSLLTIVGAGTWRRLSAQDKEVFAAVLAEAESAPLSHAWPRRRGDRAGRTVRH